MYAEQRDHAVTLVAKGVVTVLWVLGYGHCEFQERPEGHIRGMHEELAGYAVNNFGKTQNILCFAKVTTLPYRTRLSRQVTLQSECIVTCFSRFKSTS